MPGPQSQLGGLVGGRWKLDGKFTRVGLELWDLQALSQGHNHYTTQPPLSLSHTHTHTLTHTHTHTHSHACTHTCTHIFCNMCGIKQHITMISICTAITVTSFLHFLSKYSRHVIEVQSLSSFHLSM